MDFSFLLNNFSIGLLNRIALLYVINFLSHTFYLIYLNTKESIFCYLFSITSILLVSGKKLLNDQTTTELRAIHVEFIVLENAMRASRFEYLNEIETKCSSVI